MSDGSKIEWTDTTWNPVTGCTKVSPGCDHCYAERIVERFKGKGAFSTVVRSEEKLYAPLRWRRPRRVFVNSMSDLFHDDVPYGFIARVWQVMAQTPQHTYQILTKRHARMHSLLTRGSFAVLVDSLVGAEVPWPLPNVWLGVSVENQQWADIRIPALLETPAAVRWLSCEPLLGSVDLDKALADREASRALPNMPLARYWLDWVVVGGESGPGARPMELAWARSLRDQCANAAVPFFFKQWGNWVPPSQMTEDTFRDWDFHHGTGMWDMDQSWRVGKKRAGRLLDGREWNEMPA